jgi:dCMP deaminase
VRITKTQMMIEMAHVVARRSMCSRLVQVGCVVSSWDYTRIVGIGYNGQPRGFVEECDRVMGDCGCIHAEANALLKAPYSGGLEPLRMFLTLSPCVTCARLIVNSDVKEVVYDAAYRNTDGLAILKHAGIEHYIWK